MIAEQIDGQVANAKAAAGLLLMTVGRHIGVVNSVVGTKNLHPAMLLARFRAGASSSAPWHRPDWPGYTAE